MFPPQPLDNNTNANNDRRRRRNVLMNMAASAGAAAAAAATPTTSNNSNGNGDGNNNDSNGGEETVPLVTTNATARNTGRGRGGAGGGRGGGGDHNTNNGFLSLDMVSNNNDPPEVPITTTTTNAAEDALFLSWEERQRRARTVRLLIMFLTMLLLMDGDPSNHNRQHGSSTSSRAASRGSSSVASNQANTRNSTAGQKGHDNSTLSADNDVQYPLVIANPELVAIRNYQQERLHDAIMIHPRYLTLQRRNAYLVTNDGEGYDENKLVADAASAPTTTTTTLDLQQKEQIDNENTDLDNDDSVKSQSKKNNEEEISGGDDEQNKHKLHETQQQQQQLHEDYYYYPKNATGHYRGSWTRLQSLSIHRNTRHYHKNGNVVTKKEQVLKRNDDKEDFQDQENDGNYIRRLWRMLSTHDDDTIGDNDVQDRTSDLNVNDKRSFLNESPLSTNEQRPIKDGSSNDDVLNANENDSSEINDGGVAKDEPNDEHAKIRTRESYSMKLSNIVTAKLAMRNETVGVFLLPPGIMTKQPNLPSSSKTSDVKPSAKSNVTANTSSLVQSRNSKNAMGFRPRFIISPTTDDEEGNVGSTASSARQQKQQQRHKHNSKANTHVPLNGKRGKVAIQLSLRPIPGITDMSIIEGYVKLFDDDGGLLITTAAPPAPVIMTSSSSLSSSSRTRSSSVIGSAAAASSSTSGGGAASMRHNAHKFEQIDRSGLVTLKSRGIMIHSLGRISMIANADAGRSVMIIRASEDNGKRHDAADGEIAFIHDRKKKKKWKNNRKKGIRWRNNRPSQRNTGGKKKKRSIGKSIFSNASFPPDDNRSTSREKSSDSVNEDAHDSYLETIAHETPKQHNSSGFNDDEVPFRRQLLELKQSKTWEYLVGVIFNFLRVKDLSIKHCTIRFDRLRSSLLLMIDPYHIWDRLYYEQDTRHSAAGEHVYVIDDVKEMLGSDSEQNADLSWGYERPQRDFIQNRRLGTAFLFPDMPTLSTSDIFSIPTIDEQSHSSPNDTRNPTSSVPTCEFEINLDVDAFFHSKRVAHEAATNKQKKVPPQGLRTKKITDRSVTDVWDVNVGKELSEEEKEQLVYRLVGRIDSPNCDFSAAITCTALRINWARITTRAINYSFTMMLICLAQIVLLLRQLLHSQTNSVASRVSMLSVGWQSLLDAIWCIVHILLCLVMQPLCTAFASVAFFKLLMFCVIEMKYMQIIYQARQASTGQHVSSDDMRRQVAALQMRFYGSLFAVMVLYWNMRDSWQLLIVLLHSFWVPQIVRNIITEAKRPLHYYYLYGMSVSRLVAPLYVFGVKGNFIRGMNPDFPLNVGLCQVLVLWVGLQTLVLVLQGKYGARFMIPARMLPPKFEYSRPIPSSLLAPPSAPNEVDDGSPRDAESSTTRSRDRSRSGRRHRSPLTSIHSSSHGSNDASSTSVSTLDCVICYSPIEVHNRRGYMLAPCDHIFHKQCLEQWMEVKMECPICRTELPPI